MKLVAGNRIKLLANGTAFFPALRHEIDEARSEIHLETYIFADDVIGNQLAEALAAAAQRGVIVRLMIDGFGSRDFSAAMSARLRAAGVLLHIYRPDISPWTLRRQRLRRLHRKIVLIDGRIGFVGGINIIDDLTESLSSHPRFDYAVRIEGPVLADILLAVQYLWQRDADDKRGLHIPASTGVSHHNQGEAEAAFLQRDNFRHRRDIETWYRHAIEMAQQEIILCNPYFLPGIRLRRALLRAARRGVRVTILLQGRADHPLLQEATRALYSQLLAEGITIAEYNKSMLHGKVAVIDEAWATVGSSNFDPFSLFLSREANIVVRNVAFASELKASLQKAIANDATKLNAEDWRKRPMLLQIYSWLAYSAARLMAGLSGVAVD